MLLLLFLLSASPAQAAHILLERQDGEAIRTGSVVEVDVMLENDVSEDINAVAVDIDYPKEFLALKEWSDGDSIVDFWVEKPSDRGGKLSFQGIIPGGYGEKRGSLLKMYFEALQAGDFSLAVGESSRALLDDGSGTAAAMQFSSLPLSVVAAEGGSELFEFTDKVPPEPFEPIISAADNAFGGNNFLAFSTKDKDSGIDHYEVSEGGGPFVTAVSPYLLFNQRLDAPVRVKAVDRSGNETIGTVPARNRSAGNGSDTENRDAGYAAYAILALAILLFIFKHLSNQYGKARNENQKS